MLFLAIWWAWNYTAWATNWIDPERPAVRVLMLVLMLISLVMSAKIPRAFGDEAVGFAAAYVAIQVVRSAFMVAAFRGQPMGRNYVQLLAWSCMAGVVWLVGAFLSGDARLLTWILALGKSFSELHASASLVTAFVGGFILIAALWWIYFVRYAEEARRSREETEELREQAEDEAEGRNPRAKTSSGDADSITDDE